MQMYCYSSIQEFTARAEYRCTAAAVFKAYCYSSIQVMHMQAPLLRN